MRIRYTIFLLILFFVTAPCCVNVAKASHADSLFVNKELQMEYLADLLGQTRFDGVVQDSINGQLLPIVEQTLKMKGSFDYEFINLKNISVVKSKDKRVRIFTWYTVDDEANYRYYGFIQYDNGQQRLIALNDAKDKIVNPNSASLTEKNWWGAVYYGIVENSTSSGKLYTLIGWDGNGLYSTRKVLESLYFTDKGQPRFGKMVFKVGRKKEKRMIFEYNKRATMMLNFDDMLNMIVFDHLAVYGDQDANNPMFLGPDSSHDGLRFQDDVWIHVPNIDYKKQAPVQKKRRLF